MEDVKMTTVGIVSPGNQIIEALGPRTRTITIVGKNGVYYGVENFESNEWVTVWSDVVMFGREKSHRPGGYAFRAAARAQDDRAEHEAARPE
jgi:hypothetical protein